MKYLLDANVLLHLAIEKEENGFVFAPYSEIVVGMKLPDGRAA